MLEIRPVCENCSCQLPSDSAQAMICSFECTFCLNCVKEILYNVCPNCGGGFEKRPVRPARLLEKYPAQREAFVRPVDFNLFQPLLDQYKEVASEKR
jgi:uncharacterized protein